MSATVVQGGRAKALRPIPDADRRAALAAALAAWERGDWFEAHELLEPAWMGTADVAERDTYQGLIKLAAAYVHQARGNPTGVAKNLAGALARLERAAARQPRVAGIDVATLARDVAKRLGDVTASDVTASPPAIRRSRP